MKLIITLTLLVVIILVMPVFVWNIYNIDETATTGERYGFLIGETKMESFRKLTSKNDSTMYHSIYVGDSAKTFKILPIKSVRFEDVSSYGAWTITHGDKDSLLNTLRLEFDDSRLAKINRYRQLMEFP